MAPSLRDLIDFLLAEIALCGSQGASPANILSFIDVFYAKSSNDGSDRTPVVDRRLQEKVWQWLTRNPEVSVGQNREGNELTLEEAERRQLRTGDTDKKAQGSPPSKAESSPISVFVSQERTWLAITGHGPDDTKVLPMEFALLSVIASRKFSGIAQPDLIKLSCQDKRSVPKRTDILQKKGYIEKRAIQMKSSRTSLCTLRKFLTPETLASKLPAADTSDADMIDFKLFTDKLFGVMREHKIIARNDLKNLLGFADQWRWRILSRALRKFERIGVLKRVRALSQYADTMKKYHPCVMLVREPSEKDIEMFHDFSKHIYSDMEQRGDAEFDDDAEAEDATAEPSGTEDIRTMEREGGVEVSGRVLPLWSPDRCLHNQLFEVVDRTGTRGSPNVDVIRACLGMLWRRPLENTLTRLVECWQLSQPPHLRHLALVRDTALQRTITHYIHYSARNFAKLVEFGESSWEAVEFVPRNNKSNNVTVPPVDAKPQLDAYGLPLDVPTSDLVKNGDCSLADCMWVVKPNDYNCSSSDPKAIKLEDGTYTIQYGVKGQSIPSPAGRRGTPATPVRLKFEEGTSSMAPDVASTPQRKRPRKSKYDSLEFAGMSEKQKLEAMGLDETWTEYSVLLIDRPGPGVYVTSRGRRRPAGKERGRPPASRIAVFKSPKLLDIPWFVKENNRSDTGGPASPSPRPQNVDESLLTSTYNSVASGGAQGASLTRGTKRSSKRRSSGPEPDYMFQRASKLRRTSEINNGIASLQAEPGPSVVMLDGKAAETLVQEAQNSPHGHGKRKRSLSPDSGHQGGASVRQSGGRAVRPSVEAIAQQSSQGTDGNGHPVTKRPRQRSTGRQVRKGSGISVLKGENKPDSTPPDESIPSISQPATEPPADNSAVNGTPLVEDSVPPQADSSTANKASSVVPTTGAASMPPSTPGAYRNETTASHTSPTPDAATGVNRSKLLDKGGSVAFLRRRIVMDLVEKAGGAFPMGSELWYPFVTAWMKTRYKEKPDMRTLRTAVKHLVDAGKLRQQTFCGKDSKGVMVTKTIICKSSLAPDDPIVKDLQENLLASKARHYFPPNIEVDPNLTKQGVTPKGVKNSVVPVESGLTVQLHQKPAAVAALEKRKGENIQRRLLRRLEIEQMRETMQEKRPSGVIRLFSIPRPGRNMASIHDITSFPGNEPSFGILKMQSTKSRPPTGGTGTRRLKRFHFPISLMAPYAMLMSPNQSFNPLNGTFSTNAGLATFTMTRPTRIHTTPEMLMLMSPNQSFNPVNGTFSTNAGLSAFTMTRPTQSRMADKRALHLPHSLDDLFTQAGRRNVGMPGETDPRSRKFIRDTNAILRWELQNQSLLQQRSEDLHYINQTINDSFESAPIEGGIRFDAGETDFTAPVQLRRRRRRGRQEREEREDRSSSAFIYEEHPPFPTRPRSPTPINTLATHYYTSPAAPQRHQQPQQRRLEKLNELMATGTESASASQLRPLVRRHRLPGSLTSSMYQNLMTAIVVVRALAGGSEGRMVDWDLVSCCFPEHDPKIIQDRGKNFLAKNRLQIAKMQSDFQERFIDAYANDEVPHINYNDLEGYNWNAVIEWANANLDVPKSYSTPDLPATREQFDDIFELREEPLVSLDELYQTHSLTLNRKRALISNVAYAAALPSKSSKHNSQRHKELSRFDTVKTWVRANILTPAEVYRASDAHAALAHLDNGLLNNALQSLVTDRVISQSNKGRVVPGRNYDITDHFLHTLNRRRPIEVNEIRRASKFKTDILDPALTQQGFYSVPGNAEDGDILALINLFSRGRVTACARDAPRNKYGLTEGGYLTRMMNKDKLRFPVDIYPVKGKYPTGNPTSEKTSTVPPPYPPRVTIEQRLSLPGKFPLWLDIHGGFIQLLWELAVAAIVGSVAVRPGITAATIAGMIKPTMGTWEVEMVLQWLVDVGVMWKSGGDGDDEPCWTVMEWWWMVLC
ncbi:hypothetical protein BDW62DRAFT_19246 [Aspergillus aurantiobrunneus]